MALTPGEAVEGVVDAQALGVDAPPSSSKASTSLDDGLYYLVRDASDPGGDGLWLLPAAAARTAGVSQAPIVCHLEDPFSGPYSIQRLAGWAVIRYKAHQGPVAAVAAKEPADPYAQVSAKATKCRRKFKAVDGPKITITFWIATDGLVRDAKSAVSDQLGECLTQAVAHTQFEPKLALNKKLDL